MFLRSLPLFLLTLTPLAAQEPDRDPRWATAAETAGPLTADETRAFMRELAEYVFQHHLKRTEGSPQRGLIYEYFRVAHAGQPDQFVQGEALDTMHDGAWFALAMTAASRATGEPRYWEILTAWQLPFYLKMLNHSDELFVLGNNDGTPGMAADWYRAREWLLQTGEKGFVPYWWDDGNSVSMELAGKKGETAPLELPGHSELAGQSNPEHRLSGYSYGSSNHLAQDLALMLQQSWLLLHGSEAPEDRRLTAEIEAAARNLQECRARHGYGSIPAVRAALGVASGDATIRRSLPEETWTTVEKSRNEFFRAFYLAKPGEQVNVPAFADNQEYSYHVGLARAGTLTEPLAGSLVRDAFLLPKLYETYSDDAPVPPGVGVFDLHPYRFVDGHPTDYRSQRKGPSGHPKPIGSRFGPQNMVVTGWALQALRRYPEAWEHGCSHLPAGVPPPRESAAEVRQALERQLGGGLRTWQAIFKAYGYIPTGIGAGRCGAGFPWDELSDTGGYAHLITAAAQWLLVLEGKTDWETMGLLPLK